MKPSKRKKLGAYPFAGVLVSISLALYVTGLFGLLVLYSNQLEKLVRENIRLEVYLRNTLTESQRLQIEKKISALPYIGSPRQGQLPIQFVSKAEAAKQFIADTGEDFTKFLGENPLHDAYLITLNPEYHTPAALQKIKKELEAMNGVFQVVSKEGLVESVNRNVTNIALILLGFLLILILTAILLINNTIRLALFSQRFLIRSMQLVGARNWFIHRPFLVRAALYGFIAGVISGVAIWFSVSYAHQKIEDLAQLYRAEQLILLLAALVVLGMLVAVWSTFFAIRKYLRMSLDELY
jgi:cell division transport system permease protein